MEGMKTVASILKTPLKKSFFTDWILPIAFAFIISILIKEFLLFFAYVPSSSMYPTLKIGDRLLITRIYNENTIHRGDILVFYSKEEDENMVKRVIGLPNDEVKISKGIVYINGEPYPEDYIEETEEALINQDEYQGIFQVPEGKYFFLGDSRNNSFDSRYWDDKYIDFKDIQGKARIIVFPFSNFTVF